MRVLDLFSGVGMFAYGMEKAGHEVVAFCEIEPWPRRVLKKHWPDVPIYEDVRELNRERLEADGIDGVEIITAGFPCQDLSVAGKQAGIRGERSGLFDEIIRLAGELRPRYIILENVAALLTGAGGDWARYVFGRLTSLRFDAEWHVIPAGNPDGLSAGAPHRRERVWIVAYSRHDEPQGRQEPAADNEGRSGEGIQARSEPAPCGREPGNVAYAGIEGSQGQSEHASKRTPRQTRHKQDGHATTAGAGTDAPGRQQGTVEPGIRFLANGIASRLARSRWLPEPRIGRVATGVPDRVNKLKALGNGLVWQIPYAIGCAIQEREMPW